MYNIIKYQIRTDQAASLNINKMICKFSISHGFNIIKSAPDAVDYTN